ncbi:MAG TPA: type II secretion system F family protein [Caulobacteraceae bacterium]|jgi:tight adherence protein B|nr:type II secretion system F family protein [Caulobacteraceae bacterium]
MENLLLLGVAALAFVTVVAIGFAFAGGKTSQEKAVKRAQAIGASTRGAQRVRTTQANTPESRRKAIVKSLQEQERQAKKKRLTLANRLLQAGLKITVPQFWLAGGGLGFIVAFATFLFLHANILVALGLGIASGLGLPQWILGFLAKRRTNKFTSTFSDAMDIIVRGIKSGLPVHDCLKIIGRETAEPLAGEFRRLVENIGVGMTLDQALEKLDEHMPTPEVRFFAIVMNIQQKTGGNLAEALNNLSTVLRARKLMKEKVKALSAEATSSAMIIGCLPPAVVLLIMVWTPGYMSPMFTDHRGWVMLGGSGIWMSLGVFVMVRMINFKF